jgi:superfamily I DNA and/or RNA helicase
MSLHKGEGALFETVVVDEAARANPLDLFIPMSLADRRIILVGDHRQLPHILEQEIERDLDKSVNEKTKDMLRKSLFERLFKALKERERVDGVKRTVTLDVQYRMHPALGAFVSDTFYKPHGESFESGRDASEFRHNLPRYNNAVAAWVDAPLRLGREADRRSKRRRVEAGWIAEEAHRILVERTDFSVGVIAFYSAQVNEILQQMERHGLSEQIEGGAFRIAENWRETRSSSGQLKERLRVGTVDAFQGKEFDVVFLSMTRSNDLSGSDEKTLRRKYGHLMIENRLCVAMSRQQRLLVVVGDAEMLRSEKAAEVITGLVKFHEFCGGENGVRLHV